MVCCGEFGYLTERSDQFRGFRCISLKRRRVSIQRSKLTSQFTRRSLDKALPSYHGFILVTFHYRAKLCRAHIAATSGNSNNRVDLNNIVERAIVCYREKKLPRKNLRALFPVRTVRTCMSFTIRHGPVSMKCLSREVALTFFQISVEKSAKCFLQKIPQP